MLNLELITLPSTLRGPDDDVYRGKVPKRMLYAAPDMAKALLALDAELGGIVYTDIYRSADASMAAVKSKRGTQRPGFSAHGFGLAFDFDVTPTLKKTRLRYAEFLDAASHHFFFCHRRDGDSSGPEAWHMSWLGSDHTRWLSEATPSHATWCQPIEAFIQDRHCAGLRMTPIDAQEALGALGLYHGEVDGRMGPLSSEALKAFQRAWNLYESGTLDTVTQRVLAFVTAQKVIHDQP